MKIMISVILLFSLLSCGNHSEIKGATRAERTSEAYGDGKHTVMPLVLPLSDDSISSFDSPITKVGFILGGFSKFFADIGATIGMGKMQLSLTQKIPEIPVEYIQDVRLKRIFFYIEPVRGPRKIKFWNRYLFGKDDVDFNFINRLAVKVGTSVVDMKTDWSPIVETKFFDTKSFLPMDKIFNEEKTHASVIDIEHTKEIVFLSYDKKKKDRYLKNKQQGITYIVNTSTPAKTRSFFSKHPKLDGVIKRIHILNKSILVELKKDYLLEEHFKYVLGEDANQLEELGVEFIEECTSSTCFDFNVSELNLIPILLKGNAIKLDAYIEAGKVPESFQLKGFIEAEVRMNLTF